MRSKANSIRRGVGDELARRRRSLKHIVCVEWRKENDIRATLVVGGGTLGMRSEINTGDLLTGVTAGRSQSHHSSAGTLERARANGTLETAWRRFVKSAGRNGARAPGA